eukprot:evm.model.scf_577EXC.6 EVM.evm.TU.scf_577EXC.6   scf_577EXC:46482-51308(+)
MAGMAGVGEEEAGLHARLGALQQDASTLINSLAGLGAPGTGGESEDLTRRVKQDLERMRACLRDLELYAEEQETDEATAQVALWLKEHKTTYERVSQSFAAAILQAKKNSQRAWQEERQALLGARAAGTVPPTFRNKQEAARGAQDVTESLRRTREMMAQQIALTGSSLEVIDSSTRDLKKAQRELQSHRGLFAKSRRLLNTMSWHDVLDKIVLWGGVLLFTIVVLYITQKRVLGLTPGFVKEQASRMFWFTLSSISHLPSHLGNLVSQGPASGGVQTPSHRTERPLESANVATFGSGSQPDTGRGADAAEQRDGMDSSVDVLHPEEENRAANMAQVEPPHRVAVDPDGREKTEADLEETDSATLESADGAEGGEDNEAGTAAAGNVEGVDDNPVGKGSTPEADDANGDAELQGGGAAPQLTNNDDWEDAAMSESESLEDTDTVSVHEDDHLVEGSTPKADIVSSGVQDSDSGAASQLQNSDDRRHSGKESDPRLEDTDTASLFEDDASEGGNAIIDSHGVVDREMPVEAEEGRNGENEAPSLEDAESGETPDGRSQQLAADASNELPHAGDVAEVGDADTGAALEKSVPDGADCANPQECGNDGDGRLGEDDPYGVEGGRRDDGVQASPYGVRDAKEPNALAGAQEDVGAVGDDNVNTGPTIDEQGRKHDEL